MSVDTYEQMTTGVSDITSIALVTLEIINNTLLINELRLWFVCRELMGNLGLVNTGWTLTWSFTLRSFNCVFTILAET